MPRGPRTAQIRSPKPPAPAPTAEARAGQTGPSQPAIRGKSIEGWVDSARLRLGIDAGLRVACRTGLWLFPLLALARFGLLRLESALADPVWPAAVAILALGVAFAVGYLWRPSRLASAVHLDRRLAAEGAVASAFELRRTEPTGYLELLVRQAEKQLLLADLPRVMPLQRPKTLGLAALLLAAFLAALAVRPRASREGPASPSLPAEQSATAALLLPAEELALLAARAERLLAGATSERGRERALEYKELVQQLKAGALDQKQALSGVAALEREVLDESKDGARPGEGGDQTDPAASESRRPSTRDQDSQRRADSAEALRRLAERLAQETAPPTARELDQIRETLERTREQSRREHQAAEAEAKRTSERLRDKERRLLEKKKEGGLSKAEETELEQTRRRLSQLERQQKRSEQAASDLDRELAEAMRELAQNEPQKASEFLDRAADGRSQEESRQLTDTEKRELLEQLRALKERLRQGEQSDLTEKLRDFERRARGAAKPNGEGQGEGRPGGSARVAPNASRAGQPAQASGSTPGGEPAEMGTGTSSQPGNEHDPNWQGEASQELGAKTEDKAAAARDTGEGASESETILTAAEAGFRAGAYERLYKDYQTVLEEMVKGETIPRGRRTEVERYFDLIRPRSD